MVKRLTNDWSSDGSGQDRNAGKPNRDYLNTLIPYLLISGGLIVFTSFCAYKGCERRQYGEEQKRVQQKEKESGEEGLKVKIQEIGDTKK